MAQKSRRADGDGGAGRSGAGADCRPRDPYARPDGCPAPGPGAQPRVADYADLSADRVNRAQRSARRCWPSNISRRFRRPSERCTAGDAAAGDPSRTTGSVSHRRELGVLGDPKLRWTEIKLYGGFRVGHILYSFHLPGGGWLAIDSEPEPIRPWHRRPSWLRS